MAGCTGSSADAPQAVVTSGTTAPVPGATAAATSAAAVPTSSTTGPGASTATPLLPTGTTTPLPTGPVPTAPATTVPPGPATSTPPAVPTSAGPVATPPPPPPGLTAVPSVAVTTAPPVAPTAVATVSAPTGRVLVDITSVTAVKTAGQGPGEIAGQPAIAVTLAIRDDTRAALDLGQVSVTAAYGPTATPAVGSSGTPAKPFVGTLRPGSTSSAVFVFRVPIAQRGRVDLSVDYLAGAPVVLFRGRIG